jgi:beta-glucosidase
MLSLFNEGCYSTLDIQRLGIPRTISSDGPTGLVCFLSNITPFGDPEVYGTAYYQSECLLAQTYNIELAEKQGQAIGDECLCGNEKGDGLPYPGWYAPGVNLHRSPFSGRNTEYYSEDPYLSGVFAANVIKSVQEKGVYANVKHFALNDQETHRSDKGIATWCDEQAMRELYLRPFERAVKEGKTHGLMTSFNRIGSEWAGGSYRLCTTILRNEWGFQGSVICDYHTDTYMDSKQMLYAGGDIGLIGQDTLKLQTSGVYNSPYVSPTDAKDANLLRRSAHNNLYALANSNIMAAEIVGYKLATWKVLVYVVDAAISVGLAVWGFFAIWTALRKKDEVAAASEAAQ